MSQQNPTRCFECKATMIDKAYKLCRYVCPHCSKRYGDPDRSGYIDIRRCETCPKIGAVKVNE